MAVYKIPSITTDIFIFDDDYNFILIFFCAKFFAYSNAETGFVTAIFHGIGYERGMNKISAASVNFSKISILLYLFKTAHNKYSYY